MLLVALLSFSSAFAQSQKAPPFISCQSEYAKYCSAQTNAAEGLRCLFDHAKDLSQACKTELERLIEVRKQAAMRGGGALSSFGGANAAGPPLPLISYDGRAFLTDDAPGITEHRLGISSPVYKSAQDTVAMSLATGQTHIAENLILDSGFAVPTDLYRVEVGAQYFHQMPERKNWGLRASLGYVGDKFSEASSDMSFSLAASYGFPTESQKGYWMFLVFMSNNSPLGNFVPIPGFIYIHRSENFTGMFGLPLVSMQWTPLEAWMFSFSAFGPTVQAEVAQGHIDKLQLFAGYGFAQQMYIPSARANDKDRLTLLEQKAMLGARHIFAETLLGELQAGYSFERKINLGDGFLNDDSGQVAIHDDWYLSWTMKYAF
jgi:hypothetical protein